MYYNVQALFEYQQAQWLCDTVLSEVTKVLKTRSRTYVLVTTWNVSKLLLLPLFSLLMYLSVVAQKKPSSVTHTYPLNHLNTYMFVLTYIHLRHPLVTSGIQSEPWFQTFHGKIVLTKEVFPSCLPQTFLVWAYLSEYYTKPTAYKHWQHVTSVFSMKLM